MGDKANLLKKGSFRNYLLTRILSASSFQIMSVAVAWQVWDITRSAFALGMLGLLQFLPRIVFLPVAGNLADWTERRKIVAVALLVQSGCLLTLTLATMAGNVSLVMIYLIMVISGTARTFEMPAMQALLPSVLPASLLKEGVTLSASAFQLSTILAPVLAGFLYGLGPAIDHGIAFLAFGAAAAAMNSVLPLRSQEFPTAKNSAWRSFIEGLKFIRGQRGIFGAISLDMMAVLLGGATAILPVIATEVLHTEAWGLGLLRAAPAVGAILVSIGLVRFPLEKHVGRWLFGSVVVFGVATVAFGLSTSLGVSLVSLAILGGADMVSVVFRGTYIQLVTPDEMRGRVGAVNGMFIGASNQLGEFESGLTAAWFGAVPAVIIGGLGTIAVALLWMRWFPELAKLKQFPASDT